jgi:hypothetical protein
MKRLNNVEITALEWICRKTGYKKEEIKHPAMGPDFILPNGSTYEVKTRYDYKYINITPGQAEQLSKYRNCQVIVFDKLSREPIVIIPFDDIQFPFYRRNKCYIIKINYKTLHYVFSG